MQLVYTTNCQREATFLDSSTVEQPAVNRWVVGSNPTRGAEGHESDPPFFCLSRALSWGEMRSRLRFTI